MDRLFTPWRYAYISGKDKGAVSRMPQRRGVPLHLDAWPGDLHCVFCNLLASVDYAIEHGMPRDEAESAAYLLERNETCFVMLNAFPYSNGHLMVVPYQHLASLAELPDATAQEVMRTMQRAERALRAQYQPDGMNMGLNLGESAGAGVAHHLHVHALPRWTGEANFMTVIAETRVLAETLADTWTKLRETFRATPK